MHLQLGSTHSLRPSYCTASFRGCIFLDQASIQGPESPHNWTLMLACKLRGRSECGASDVSFHGSMVVKLHMTWPILHSGGQSQRRVRDLVWLLDGGPLEWMATLVCSVCDEILVWESWKKLKGANVLIVAMFQGPVLLAFK